MPDGRVSTFNLNKFEHYWRKGVVPGQGLVSIAEVMATTEGFAEQCLFYHGDHVVSASSGNASIASTTRFSTAVYLSSGIEPHRRATFCIFGSTACTFDLRLIEDGDVIGVTLCLPPCGRSNLQQRVELEDAFRS